MAITTNPWLTRAFAKDDIGQRIQVRLTEQKARDFLMYGISSEGTIQRLVRTNGLVFVADNSPTERKLYGPDFPGSFIIQWRFLTDLPRPEQADKESNVLNGYNVTTVNMIDGVMSQILNRENKIVWQSELCTDEHADVDGVDTVVTTARTVAVAKADDKLAEVERKLFQD